MVPTDENSNLYDYGSFFFSIVREIRFSQCFNLIIKLALNWCSYLDKEEHYDEIEYLEKSFKSLIGAAIYDFIWLYFHSTVRSY